MKKILFLITSLFSVFSLAGFGGIGGGSSNISLDELKSYLKSNQLKVEMPQMTFSSEEFNGTAYVSVSSVCHRNDTFETIQQIYQAEQKKVSIFKLVRSQTNYNSTNEIIPLDQVVQIYKILNINEPERGRKFLGSKVFTIPECSK